MPAKKESSPDPKTLHSTSVGLPSPLALSLELDSALYSAEERDYIRKQLEKASRLKKTRSKKPVAFILPGILGSPLGTKYASGKTRNVIWLDPKEIPCGGLKQLRLPEGKQIGALPMESGILLESFYRLTASTLLADDFEVFYLPFDWRRSLDYLGESLAETLSQKFSGREVHLVGHSMGGLVARMAMPHIKTDRVNLKTLVTVGTPLGGAVSPLLAMRGLHSLAIKISKFDFAQDADEMAALFATFPGLIEMMPRGPFSSIDIFDANSWPSGYQMPRGLKTRLAEARGVLDRMGSVPDGCEYHTIFGDGISTMSGVSVTPDGFRFQKSSYGDGTVPTEHALAGHLANSTWFLHSSKRRGIGEASDRAEHGALMKQSEIAIGVTELLRRGRPSQLSSTPNPSPREETVSESELRLERRKRNVRTRPLNEEDVLKLNLSVLNLAQDNELVREPRDSFNLNALSMRKSRSRYLEVETVHGDIADLEADALVFGVIEGIDPVGAIAAVDEAMQGVLKDAIDRRQFQGHQGGVYLLPAGRRLRADYVILVGLGSTHNVSENSIKFATQNLMRTLCQCQINHFATVLIGSGLGDIRYRLEALLLGVTQSLEECDPQRNFRRMSICEYRAETFDSIREDLIDLATSTDFTRQLGDIELDFRERRLPILERETTRSKVAYQETRPVILDLRTSKNEEGSKSSWQVDATWTDLSGEAAALKRESKIVLKAEVESLLAVLPDFYAWEEWQPGEMKSFGTQLGRLMLPDEVLKRIDTCQRHLVLLHDSELAIFPWETLVTPSSQTPAKVKGLSRRIVLNERSAGKWSKPAPGKSIGMLLISNPTGDLDGAKEESDAIEALLQNSRIQITRLSEKEATKARILKELESSQYDILHCASHAQFKSGKPSESGILTADGEVLSGVDLTGLLQVPAFVFINACESGRTRLKRKRRGTKKSSFQMQRNENLAHGILRAVSADDSAPPASLAEEFLRGGVGQFVGTYWPVGDASAKNFSTTFYESLLDGESIAEAILLARRAIESDEDWADYIHYGSPDYRI